MGIFDKIFGNLSKGDISAKTVFEINKCSNTISELVEEFFAKNPKYSSIVSKIDLITCVKAKLYLDYLGLFNIRHTEEQVKDAINICILEVCMKNELLQSSATKLKSLTNTNKAHYRTQYESANEAIVLWKNTYNKEFNRPMNGPQRNR